MMRRAWRRLFLPLACCVAALGALAPLGTRAADGGDFPSRPLRLVVPFGTGSQMDLTARLVAANLAEALGQPVVVDNRTGASGNIASDAVAKAPADGYTLLVSGALITLLPSTLEAGAVDPVAAFAPVIKLGHTPLMIVADARLGVDTLPALVALAKERPGRIAYATQGIGSPAHLSAVMLSQQAGISLLHVPYALSSRALTDVLAGDVPVYYAYQGAVEQHVRAGTLKLLAVANPRRMVAWPDVPTLAELGYARASVDPWDGVLAPAGTPPAIVERLYREILQIVRRPDVREKLLAVGIDPLPSSPAEFAAEIARLTAGWPAIVRSAGIRGN
jgi:tripartite-type tricarboxylate transporter receptor subunit TctC